MLTRTKPMTIEEFEALGEDAPYELIRGDLYEMAPTKFVHMAVAGVFSTKLGVYGAQTLPGRVLVGEGGFYLEMSPDSLIAPDVAFIRAERWSLQKDQQDWGRVPPDVAVEVKSPTNTRKEIARKVEVYLGSGVALVLVADTDRKTISAHTKDGRVRVYRVGEDLDVGDVLPGFRVPVSEFFE
jgi:Uma2 family endonuclease